MPHPVKGIDHVYLLVNDLEASAEQYRKLGFTLSPRGLHSKEKGTGNYTIMFPHDYFELLGIVNETAGNQFQRDKLADEGEGLHAIACRIDSAEQAKKELLALDISTGNIGAFSRPVDLPDGSKSEAAFETVQFEGVEVPQGTVFMCQHKTPEAVWIPELLNHENGAKGLYAITAISSRPEATAKAFARLYAQGEVTSDAEGMSVVATGAESADIIVLSPSRASREFPDIDFTKTPKNAFAALSIQVSSLDQVRRVFERNDIVWVETDRGVAVKPENASGTLLEFVAD